METANSSAVNITVTDVAREAGVSASTVSRIMNGTAHVTESKRIAVEAVIARTHFQPNLQARSLKIGRSMTIGMLTQDIESPFFTRVMRGIEEGLKDSGYSPIIASGNWNPKAEMERVDLLMGRRIDGLVILNGGLTDEQVRDISNRQPVVATGRRLEGRNLKALRLDHEQGGFLASQYLLSMGHRRIAYIRGPMQQLDAIDRYAGFVRAHQELGVAVIPELVSQGDFLENGGVLAMTRLLDSGQIFSAVLAGNDQSAMGARMVLHRRGIRVPDDISLMGFDDLPVTAFLTPPLTTVRQPLYETGLFLAKALLRMLGREVENIQEPQMELVIRETVKRC